ncbi:SusC/RagA family TonB-linked outer membrane protein [Sphingobacterium faecium NBRC 15299]|uniref:SusC/RagA family TonB-linked outer membrane protein n=1 Tax=Sphingobacterium faecium TaxID=34087 RepID=UPI000D4B3A97|nr:SusC/RagA family TonB-linked outer membrane protein [Sphingobacterium faecium]PTX14045.1 TonB-linked SusC/RagA family outer membrane protein [Sphingobacterium faecium]GEM64124.1 SusC/RagA family TonB-linked outer membrane protein [Sphingobacterium faecium NBRC 15299]
MMKYTMTLIWYEKRLWGILLLHIISFLILLLGITPVYAQELRQVRGTVVDQKNQAVESASVKVKDGTTGISTDINGSFSIQVPKNRNTLVISKIGYTKTEVNINNKTELQIVLNSSNIDIDEIVVVGYGTQKKETVVGAVTQTTGKVLERAGGVASVGAALTGNVPGVVTTASTGMPGEEDPRIVIRGRSTWNNTDPLTMVDGVERPLSSVDISSIETVSVLKDATATAVYGVRGANGVILITTKRGKEGRASVRGTVNNIIKTVSQLPGKMDSYDAMMLRNRVIENELALSPNSWVSYQPQNLINKYRFPANQEERERYVNTNWAEELFKGHAFSQNSNLNIAGGTNFVKYFASADYLYEGDMFRENDNNRGYKAGYGFNRLNMRSNLDFQLTPTTKFSANLAGSHGRRKSPWGGGDNYNYWIAAYTVPPDVIYPRYADGTWGFYKPDSQVGINSAQALATSGVELTTTSKITSDFILEQDLKMFVDGLKVRGSISLDNTFVEAGRGVNDLYNSVQSKWIDPETGLAVYGQNIDNSRFDFVEGINWAQQSGAVNNGLTYRRLFYQLQLDYATQIANDHNITAMGLFNRNQYATGSIQPFYREDWVFRTTYNYKGKYMLDYSGAYTGSEKFARGYRFGFFNSGGIGWLLSEENFMKNISFLDMLKLRASYGDIGDDNVNGRYLYLTQWSYGGQSHMGTVGEAPERSTYTWYKENELGNPNVRWEKVRKLNFGTDFSFFNGVISGQVNVFSDKRTDVLITGNNRAVPDYFGVAAPAANLGIVTNKGYEVELKVSKAINQHWRLWGDMNFTHAKDKVIEGDSPALLPDYQKLDDKQISQTYTYVGSGYYNTWDELYASTIHDNNDGNKLPGNYHILDYNGDGLIDSKDNIPYAYPSTPQNTYNLTVGFDWKNLSIMTQWYGVNNVTRQVVLNSFERQRNLAYYEGSYWSKDQTNADVPLPRWLSEPSSYTAGDRFMYDGSYIRLKTAEIAYNLTADNNFIRRMGFQHIRIFLNGHNLLFWSKMPDDRESNYAGTGWASQGAYPTVKRFNLGANITF